MPVFLDSSDLFITNKKNSDVKYKQYPTPFSDIALVKAFKIGS